MKYLHQKRIFGLDIIRAFAIIFVMIIHSGNFVPKKFHSLYSLLFFDGVGVFFVLSGFLIGNILIGQILEKGINYKTIRNFWLKRWTRTLPNYFIILFLLVATSVIYQKDFKVNFLPYLFFTQNFFSETTTSFFNWSWSLAVEEWFYLMLPLLIVFFYSFNSDFKNSLLLVIIAMILISNFYRFFIILNNDDSYTTFKTLRYSVVSRLDGLIVGVFGAYLQIFKNHFWKKKTLLFLYLGVFLFILEFVVMKLSNFNENYFFRTIELGVFPFIILCFFPFFNSIKDGKNNLFYKSITLISTTSYSLYLINSIVSNMLDNLISSLVEFCQQNHIIIYWGFLFLLTYISFWGISIFLSKMFYELIEKKAILLLRKKLVKNY